MQLRNELSLVSDMMTGRLFGNVWAEGVVRPMDFQEIPVTGYELVQTAHPQDK